MILDDFKEILDNYSQESRKQMKNNELALKMRNEFTNNFKDFVIATVNHNADYKVKISPGMGSWARTPWAGILNKKVTKTFQKGLYLIYIFDIENNTVCLSLDQGSNNPSDAVREEITNYLIDIFKKSDLTCPEGFVFDESKINNDSVLCKFYDINNLTLEEFQNDLTSLIRIYEFLIPYYHNFTSSNTDSSKIIKEYVIKNNLNHLKNDEYENSLQDFNNRFSPGILEKLEGLDILNKIFLHDGDKSNLCYSLEFEKDYRIFGSIGGGSSYKFSLFKNKNNVWVSGSSRNSIELSESEAIAVGESIRDSLVEGAKYIESCDLISLNDYISLEDKLNEIFKNCIANPVNSWVHKYYVLIFPEKFPPMHSDVMKKDFLKKLNISPQDGFYANDWQFCKLSEKADVYLYSIFDERIMSLFDDGSVEKSDDGIGDSDVRSIHYWLISAGYGGKWWDEFYQNGEIGVGFDGTGDLNQYVSKEEIKHKFQEIYNDESSHRNDVHACWQFVHEMKIGDVVFVKNGFNGILGRGIIESDYQYDENKSYHKFRKVKWTHNGNWITEDNLPTKTLTDITDYKEFSNKIKQLFVNYDEHEIQYPEYDADDFLKEVYISEEEYNTLVSLLKNKKNLIVQGAPGVGKTFMAKRLAYSIMGKKDIERVMMVQFHQSYSYEDFVMGYRPSKDGFELRMGSFYDFCKRAEEDSENDYFFIIDEINRGNLSKIFGELFMLIEADKRGDKNKIQLLYADESFFIPKNVYMIGLMNTADRSLAMIDYALRRRFAFFDLKPGFSSKGFKKYQESLGDMAFDNLVDIMNGLNLEIKNDESLGEGFRIGHSYLCNIKPEDVEERLSYIVEYELIPLLKEYWFDEEDKISEWSNRLRSVIN